MLKVRLHSESGVIPVEEIAGRELLAFFTPDHLLTSIYPIALLGEFKDIYGELNDEFNFQLVGWYKRKPETTAAKLLLSHIEGVDFAVERLLFQMPKSYGKWMLIAKDSEPYGEYREWGWGY